MNVIPHGVSDRYFDGKSNTLKDSMKLMMGDQKYLLYIGGSLERKRFSWAIEVFRQVRRTESDVLLAACGFAQGEVAAAINDIPSDIKSHVRVLPFVSEDEMPALYHGASAVLYPTLYEGFGLPVVEAIACGAPILFSGVGSLEELQGPGSIVLPPHELTPWVEEIRRAIHNTESRDLRKLQGQAWARRYSWAASADMHMAVYLAAVGRQSGFGEIGIS